MSEIKFYFISIEMSILQQIFIRLTSQMHEKSEKTRWFNDNMDPICMIITSFDCICVVLFFFLDIILPLRRKLCDHKSIDRDI